MAVGFIKAQKKEETSLRMILHRHLSGYRDGRDIKNLHASEVTHSDPEFCPRLKALRIKLGQENPDEFLSTSLAVTFDIGRKLEDSIVGWFAEMGMAVGDWKCVTCGSEHIFQKRPHKCKTCGCAVFKYKEWRVESPVTGVTCGIDLLLDKGGKKLKAVELKSMDKEQFKALAMPLAEHRSRSRLYLQSIAESTDPRANRVDTSSMEILYVSKGGFGTACSEVETWSFKDASFSPFKPFVIERDDGAIEEYTEKGKAYQQFRETGKLPPRICPTTFHPQAKKCKHMIACFGGDY